MGRKANLLIEEPPLQVLPTLAKRIGLNEAMVLQQLHYWLQNPKVGKERNGQKWVFNTYEEWAENFPFWSVSTIRRIFTSLEGMNLVVGEQLDKKDWDMRKSYRIDYEQVDALNLDTSRRSEWAGDNRNTETTSENTSEKPVFPENAKNLTGISNKIFAGLPITEADLSRERHVSQATAEFERALMLRMPWGKESKFQAWVAEQYAKDATCFARYAKWQKDDPFKSMSAKQIRHTPQELMDTWPAFEAMFKPKSADAPDPELERLRAEAKQTWSKPPERK